MHIKALLFVAFGFVFLGLGAIGLFLPVWPTTPFVLVSAACFSATPHLRERIMRINFFREYIESYGHKTGLSRKTTAISLVYLWGMLLLSMLLTRTLWIVLLLTAIGIAVTIHILYMAKKRNGGS